MPHQVTTAKVRDVTVRLHRGGGGRPALFLHGAGGVPLWLPFFEALAEDYDLLVPDHPGFGASEDPKWLRSISDVAMFYLDAIEEWGLRDIHVIGNSLGGWIAAEMAIRDCSRFRSLTLLAPAGIRIKGVPMGDNFIWSPEEQARNLFADPSFAERMLSQPPSEEQMDIQLRNRFTTAKLAWQPRLFDPDLEKWLHRVKVPTHVVWGNADKILPGAYAELWRQRLPDARVTLVPNCGHLPHVEKADSVTASVKAFLSTAAA